MFNHPNAGLEDRCVLTPAQQQVVDLLAQGATISAAADSVSIHRNTVANWRRTSPVFRAALDAALEEHALLRREQVEALIPKAIETLAALLADTQGPPSVRLKAALAILDRAAEPMHNLHNLHNPEPVHPSKIHVIPPTAPESVHNLHNSAQPEPEIERTNPIRASKIGRNESCPCGSGQKYKRCCLGKRIAAGLPG